MPWFQAMLDDHPNNRVYNPTHYRQMATTASCGATLLDLLVNRTEVLAEVTCPLCADLRTSYEAKVSKLGQSEGETA